jgi:thiamine-monophosphate kinase
MLAEARLATAMIDVSDGLLADLGHILDQSGVGAFLELARLPVSEDYGQHFVGSGSDPFLHPLTGGEDYELLFTALPEHESEIKRQLDACGVPVTVIGEIVAARGLSVMAPDGSSYNVARKGYNHFGADGIP